jgi:epoxyqueuosine reductase
MIEEALLAWSASLGYRVAWAPVGVLTDALADIRRRRTAGEIDEAFAHENLDPAFSGPVGLDVVLDLVRQAVDPARWRVLVVVMPRPAHVVTFLAGGVRAEAVMPPTYERYRPVFEDVRQALLETVLRGAALHTLNVPLKALAARLGLVRYGRNNVTYAPSIGSYLQLLGYLTDAGLPVVEGWQASEPLLLDECADCGVCEAVCPTGAIGSDRVLVRAERCLTLANETPGAWPSWVPPGGHHCLIGCLLCQRACPANPPLPVERTRVVFTEEETSTLLGDSERVGPTWDSIRAKLEDLGQPYQEEVMGRNLRALLRCGHDRRADFENRVRR